jgi:GT2 family glycosyltransferase
VVDISIIIVNWNTRQLLLDCIASIYATVHAAAFEIFVVDNGSTDGSVEAVAGKYPDVKIIENARNEGFAKANNAAIRGMTGEYAVLLNSDTILKEQALDGMLAFMRLHPEAGMCGPQLLFRDGSRQTSMGIFPDYLSELTSASIVRLLRAEKRPNNHIVHSEPVPVDFIIGACMFVRKAAIDSIGMLDEEYFFFYEEIDWCYRMKRAGWLVYHLPGIEIFHFAKQATKGINQRAGVESWRSRYIYFRKTLGIHGITAGALVGLGFAQTAFRTIGYLFLNLPFLFLRTRLRRRWLLFLYLFIWHLRGMPVSMGLPR